MESYQESCLLTRELVLLSEEYHRAPSHLKKVILEDIDTINTALSLLRQVD